MVLFFVVEFGEFVDFVGQEEAGEFGFDGVE